MAMMPKTPPARAAAAPSVDGGGLDTIREICVPPTVGERVKRRFSLQDEARRLLPDERVAECIRRINPVKENEGTVKVMQGTKHAKPFFKGVITCGSAWVCPICAAKITERRKVELQDGLVAHPELKPVMVTLTLQHWREDSLESRLDLLKGGLRFARSGASWRRIVDRLGIQGSITATEITWGNGSGWHPHSHILLLCSRILTESELAELKGFFLTRYGGWIERNEGYVAPEGVDVRNMDAGASGYLAKWGPAEELTKANVKLGRGDRIGPWGLLAMSANGDGRAGKLFQEFAKAVRGKRVLSFSDGLRDRLELGQEKTDEELAVAEEETAVVLATLDRYQWAAVVGNCARGELLEVAASGDPEKIWLWLEQLLCTG